jgi:hypothetical protein
MFSLRQAYMPVERIYQIIRDLPIGETAYIESYALVFNDAFSLFVDSTRTMTYEPYGFHNIKVKRLTRETVDIDASNCPTSMWHNTPKVTSSSIYYRVMGSTGL